MQFLVQGYGDGITPLPCSRFNRAVKFGPMLDWAEKERGITRWPPVITPVCGPMQPAADQLLGARCAQRPELFPLRPAPGGAAAADLSREPDTRAEAAQLLRTAEKPESQDLCCRPSRLDEGVSDAYLPERPGEIVLAMARWWVSTTA